MTDLSQIAEHDRNEARRRAVIIRPLAELKHCPRSQARAAARILNCHHATLYRALALHQIEVSPKIHR